MTTEQLQRTAQIYIERLESKPYALKPKQIPKAELKKPLELGEMGRTDTRELLSHCLWLLHEASGFAEKDPAKANRWLGFVQGILAALGSYTIQELREHNQP